MVLGGLEVLQNPCPDLTALQGWMLGQAARRQGCWQGREHAVVLLCLHSVWAGSHPSQLRALAAPSCQRPNLSEDRTAAALHGTCPSVTCPVALLFSPLRGGPQPGAMPPVLAEPAAQDAGERVHLPPQGDRWVWHMGTLTLGLSRATSPCKGGTLVPRHWGGHPSRTDAGERGTRVRPPSLCSEQHFISGLKP